MEQDDEERVDVAPVRWRLLIICRGRVQVGHRRGGCTPQGQMGGEYGEEMGRLADMLVWCLLVLFHSLLMTPVKGEGVDVV